MVGTELTLLDGAIIAVLLVAILRGLFIGLIREGFSLAALAAAVLATRYGTEPAARWLQDVSGAAIGPALAPWLAGAVIAVASVGLVGLAGGLIRRGARLAGLGLADRMGGAALGAAEGVIIAMLIVLVSTWTVGREHPAVASSQSLQAYDLVRAYVDERSDDLPEVAAPGRWR